MVEKLEHHGLVRLLENGYKIQIVAIQLYKETGVLFYLISMNLPIQSWRPLQQCVRYQFRIFLDIWMVSQLIRVNPVSWIHLFYWPKAAIVGARI